MKEKNIQELAKRMGLITIENMCQYTIAQLVYMVANKVNELIDEVGQFESDVVETVKTQNENIQYLLGEGLHLEVATVFERWVEDGTFDTLINQTALKRVNERIDETNAQLSQKMSKGESINVSQINKNAGKLDESYMSDEFLQQIAGNTPIHSVPADNSITNQKLTDYSVSATKLFRQCQQTYIYSNDSDIKFTFNSDSLTIEIPGYSYVCLNTEFYPLNNTPITKTTTVSFPNAVDGLCSLWFMKETKTLVIHNYTTYHDVKYDPSAILIGVLSPSHKTIYVNGCYNILNKQFDLTPTLCFSSPILVEDNKLKIPSFYFKNRSNMGGKMLTPGNCGINKDYFEFDIPGGYVANFLVLKYDKLLNYSETSTTNEVPFEFTTGAKFPSYHAYDVEIAQTLYGNVTSRFNIEVVKSDYSTYSENDNRLILPDKMFFIDEDYLPIYKSAVVPNNSDTMKMSVQYVSENDAVFNYFYEDYHLESSKIPSTFKIGVRQNKDNTLYFKDIQKLSANPKNVTNKTPKIMHLGDSITNRNIAYRNELILKKYGITPTFVGTMNNGNSKRGEGREGWRYSNFVGQHNVYLNNGNPIYPQPNGTTSDLEKNPFLKLATDEDKRNYPNWCFRNTGSAQELSYSEDTDKSGDFYIFDFAWYMENHNVDAPDIITIALSTNDINTLSWWEDSCSLGLDIMYKQIRKALPNVKIGIIPSPSWGFTNTDWSAKVVKWIELCMQQVNAYNDNKLFIVPVWCHINKEWTFPQKSSENLSDINTSKKTTLSDAIHFSSLGEQQYGKVMASFCINML